MQAWQNQTINNVHTQTHMHKHTHTHMHAHTHITHTHTHACTHTHARTQACTHTHTHTHTHTPVAERAGHCWWAWHNGTAASWPHCAERAVDSRWARHVVAGCWPWQCPPACGSDHPAYQTQVSLKTMPSTTGLSLNCIHNFPPPAYNCMSAALKVLFSTGFSSGHAWSRFKKGPEQMHQLWILSFRNAKPTLD